MDYLSQPISNLKRTRSLTFKYFNSLGVHTFFDLLRYYPFRYEDYSKPVPIAHLVAGTSSGIRGVVEKARQIYTRSGLKMQYIRIRDSSGSIDTLWFNQPYLLTILKPGMEASIVGELDPTKKGLFKGIDFELVRGELIHTGRLVPVYSETRGLSTRTIREKVWNMIAELPTGEVIDPLPETVRLEHKLISLELALLIIHFPPSIPKLIEARRRLGFDELLYIQLSSQLIRQEWHKEKTPHVFRLTTDNQRAVEKFISSLPFELTEDQKKGIEDIENDMSQSHPMNRFLQGDVGSGKTVVAAVAAYIAHLFKKKTLLMAPTEILARQHYATLGKMFSQTEVRIGLQTGANKDIKKDTANNFDILVGTQALIALKLSFDDVALVVVDEQHRFGVRERALLKEKGTQPHLLTMTATPTPRTVALTMYGELDLSAIVTMPAGRTPIKTYPVPPHKRNDAYAWIRKQIEELHTQVFIICPLVEESESETMKSVRAVTAEYENLSKTVFPMYSVGLLHGKLKSKEKEQIMKDFRDNKHQILLSTSVVEVGIDIPNATIMIIEGAERFGMAQLHQLRGRVGRGTQKSYCLLFTSDESAADNERLVFFSKHTNGAELAEYDLETRGPGSIFGTKQHGHIDLKLASITDYELVSEAQEAARVLIEKDPTLNTYPAIQLEVQKLREAKVSRD